jgi:hypothetical protein
MLSWFRLQRRSLASVVLLSLAVMGASSAAPHADDCHDTACAGVYVPHDESAHRLRAGSSEDSRHPLHCTVCHLTRSFSRVVQVSQNLSIPPERVVRYEVHLVRAPRTSPAAQPPLRSPPSSPESVS